MTVNVANDWIQQLYVREFGNKLLPTDYYYNGRHRIDPIVPGKQPSGCFVIWCAPFKTNFFIQIQNMALVVWFTNYFRKPQAIFQSAI